MLDMFTASEGVSFGLASFYWLVAATYLFVLNEITRRFKWVGFFAFFILPIILTALWFTVMSDNIYSKDWFPLVKIYSCTAGCIGFWLLRFVKGTDKETGKEWRLIDNKWALLFPPAILAINILEAVIRDFQVGYLYSGLGLTTVETLGELETYLAGSWNYMNGIAGILNILTITGWVGITIRKKTKTDGSRDMLWPDMLWFWIIAYDLWNFAFTYNCYPTISFYIGFALLVPPTICAFTVGKGAWLQHRAHTLSLMCLTIQTFPVFFTPGSKYCVTSAYDPHTYFIVSFLALASNVAVFAYMLYRIKVTGRNPYKEELYTDHQEYIEIKSYSVNPGEAEAAA